MFKRVDELEKTPFVTAKFGNNWKEHAKQNYDLIDEDEKDDISDFDDDDLIMEAEKRKLHLRNAEIKNENIINENYFVRFAEIINRGNDIEIDEVLETLEKKYHIK